MLTLTRPDQGRGKTPWCIAAESTAATGWPITDWIEDLVLRLAGPDNYDKWVTGALKFNSPEIKPAFEYFQKIAFTDGNVRGGTKAIVATNFQTGGNPLFDNPPGCYLFKQATFVANKGGFPDAVIAKLDTETRPYAFPPKAEGDNSVLVAGDIVAAFNNDANSIKLRNFIASKENGTQQAKNGAFSPHTSADVSVSCRTRRSRRSPRRSSTRRRRRVSTGPTSCRPRSARARSGPSRSSGSRVSRTWTPR